MNAKTELNKLKRRMKLLTQMEMANRKTLAAHADQLTSLQRVAADLDSGGQTMLDTRFLDIRTTFRNSLEPQMVCLQALLAAENGRAAVLKDRVKDTMGAIRNVETTIQSASHAEELLERLNRGLDAVSPVSRKLTGQ